MQLETFMKYWCEKLMATLTETADNEDNR